MYAHSHIYRYKRPLKKNPKSRYLSAFYLQQLTVNLEGGNGFIV